MVAILMAGQAGEPQPNSPDGAPRLQEAPAAAQCGRNRERHGPGSGRCAGGPPSAAGGEGMTRASSVTGQRRGEAVRRAVRVFKRCSKKGDLPPLWVSEEQLQLTYMIDIALTAEFALTTG